MCYAGDTLNNSTFSSSSFPRDMLKLRRHHSTLNRFLCPRPRFSLSLSLSISLSRSRSREIEASSSAGVSPFNHRDNRSFARMGARETRDKKTSLKRVLGEVTTEEIVCCVDPFGDVGVDAIVCNISPIYTTLVNKYVSSMNEKNSLGK